MSGLQIPERVNHQEHISPTVHRRSTPEVTQSEDVYETRYPMGI